MLPPTLWIKLLYIFVGFVKKRVSRTDRRQQRLGDVGLQWLTVPLQLTDQDSGAPLSGVAVALGNDPTVVGSAMLVILDPTEAHPLQVILLEGAPSSTSGVKI